MKDPYDLFRVALGSRLVNENLGSFPPHNIVKFDDGTFLLMLAVAGYQKSDIDVSLHQGILTISGSASDLVPERLIPERCKEYSYVHQGIAERTFKRSFQIGETAEVTGADLSDGMLRIGIRPIVPPEARPKSIPIMAK